MRFDVTTRTTTEAGEHTTTGEHTASVSWFGSAELLAHTTSLAASVLRTGRTVVEVTGAADSAAADTRDLTPADRARAIDGLLDHTGSCRASMLRHLLGTPLTPEQRATPAEPSASTRAAGNAWVRHTTGITDPRVPSHRASSQRYAQDRESLSALAAEASAVRWTPDHETPDIPGPDARTAAAALLTVEGDRPERMLDHIHDITLAHDTGTVDQVAAAALQHEIRTHGETIDHHAREDHCDRAITADTDLALQGNDDGRAAALLRLRDRAEDAYALLGIRDRDDDRRGQWTMPSVTGDGRRVDVLDYHRHVEHALAEMDPETLAAANGRRVEEVAETRTRYRFEATDPDTGRSYTVETRPADTSLPRPSAQAVLIVDDEGGTIEWSPPEKTTADPAADVAAVRAALNEAVARVDPGAPRMRVGGVVCEFPDGHQLRTDGGDVVEHRAPDTAEWNTLPPMPPPVPGESDTAFRIYAADVLAVEVPTLAREVERDIEPDGMDI